MNRAVTALLEMSHANMLPGLEAALLLPSDVIADSQI